MKTILVTTCKALGWLGLCLLFSWLGYVLSMADANELYSRGYTAGYDYIKSIKELQIQVGCKKIDGKVSPDYQHSETQTKWVAAICQQYANIQINNRSLGIAE